MLVSDEHRAQGGVTRERLHIHIALVAAHETEPDCTTKPRLRRVRGRCNVQWV